LAEQNDLFSAAMAAERQGQHELALRKLDELVERYPGGPLSESARAQRQRILSAK
jgi:TolA-binding protein